MELTIKEVSFWFLDRGSEEGKILTKDKLESFLFLSYAWYLAVKGTEMYDVTFFATEEYPKIDRFERLYHDFFAEYAKAKKPLTPLDDFSESFLEKIWDKYDFFSDDELHILTNSEYTPNQKTYFNNFNSITEIPTELIRNFYIQRLQGLKNFSFTD